MISCGHPVTMELGLEQRAYLYHKALSIKHCSLQILSFKSIITEKGAGYKLTLVAYK